MAEVYYSYYGVAVGCQGVMMDTRESVCLHNGGVERTGAEMGQKYILVGYFASWMIYERNFQVHDIEAKGLTHLSYAFAHVKDGLPVLGDPWADLAIGNSTATGIDPSVPLGGNFLKLLELKENHRTIKTGLSIGGWGIHDFSRAAATHRSRKAFAEKCAEMLRLYCFDYIDIDWEYPVSGGPSGMVTSQKDRSNFVLLARAIKDELSRIGRERGTTPLLTIAVPSIAKALANFDLKGLLASVDYFMLMGYDFFSLEAGILDHDANLLSRDSEHFSVDKAVRYLESHGVPAERLVLGVPFYAKAFRKADGFIGSAFTGKAVDHVDYRLLDKELKDAVILNEEKAAAKIAYHPRTRSVITYDDRDTVLEKARYVKRNGLGGMMYWEISQDLPVSDPLSLRRTVHDWLGSNMDDTINYLPEPRLKDEL